MKGFLKCIITRKIDFSDHVDVWYRGAVLLVGVNSNGLFGGRRWGEEKV